MNKLLLFSVTCLCFFINNIRASYLFSYDNSVFYDAVDVSQIAISDFGNTQKVDIYGGQIDTTASLDNSIISIHAGMLKNVSVRESSNITIYGGQNKVIGAFNYGTMNIYGGNITYLGAFESSVVNFYGYDFEVIRYDIPVWGTVGPTDGLVTGYWGDGTPFSIEIGNYHGEESIENPITFDHLIFHEIPEPASLLLLGLGGLFLRRKSSRTLLCLSLF